MNNAFVLLVELLFGCDIFTAVVGAKNAEFLSGLAFDFLVPRFERCKRVAFLMEIADPRVA